jgi:hypothetical protein
MRSCLEEVFEGCHEINCQRFGCAFLDWYNPTLSLLEECDGYRRVSQPDFAEAELFVFSRVA